VIIKVGPVTLRGAAASLTLLLLLAVIGAALMWVRPTLRMSLTASLWTVFVVYWSIAARRVAPTLRSESTSSRALHRWLLNISLLFLFLPVPGLRARFLPLATSIVAAGLIIQALGILLAAWARHHLGRYWSGAVAVAVHHELVRSGPYHLVRHPIYSAMFVMFLGTCMVSGELHALLGLTVLAAAYWRKIPQEERTMRETFGPAYDLYCGETWALVPGLL
jgi:protein-S-isoprenylcysteine O-methyltransferase Ste14